MKVYNEKNINLNKPFSYNVETITPQMQSLIAQIKARIDNESNNTMVLQFAFDDGIETSPRIFTGLIKTDAVLRYKQNEELDSINIELIDSVELSGTNVLDFKIPNRTRCRIYYNCSHETFDGTLYDDFVLVGGNFIARKQVDGSYLYLHGYNLVEPIYLTRYIAVDTNTFTNLPNVRIYSDAETYVDYTQDETNALSALNRILKITNIGESDSVSMFDQITIGQDIQSKLANAGIGRNYFYNATTLYDVLFRIFKKIDCYPILNWNGTGYILDAVQMNGENVASYDDDIFEDCTTIVVSDLSEKQASQIVVNAQNVTSDIGIKYPSNEIKGESIKYEVGEEMDFSDFIGKPKENIAQYVIYTPSPIYRGDYVYIHYNWKISQSLPPYYMWWEQLIKYNLVKKQDWEILDADVKDITAYFDENTKVVHVMHIIIAEYKRQRLDDISYPNLLEGHTYSTVSYYPFANPKLIEGQTKGFQEVIAQEDSAVNGVDFGEYVEQYAKFNSGVNIQFGKVFEHFSNIIPVGSKIDSQWGLLTIMDAEIKFKQNVYEVQYSASVQTPLRSDEIEYDSNVENKFIDPNLVQERKFNFYEFIKLSFVGGYVDYDLGFVSIPRLVNLAKDQILEIVSENNNKQIYYHSQMTYYGSENTFQPQFYRPIAVSRIGSSIVFEVDTDEATYNYSGGMTDLKEISYTTATKVSDHFGRVDDVAMNVLFSDDIDDDYEDYSQLSTTGKYEVLKDTSEKLSIAFQLKFGNDFRVSPDFVQMIFGKLDFDTTYTLYIGMTNDFESITRNQVTNSGVSFNHLMITCSSNIQSKSNYAYLTLELKKVKNGTTTYETLMTAENPLSAASNTIYLRFSKEG